MEAASCLVMLSKFPFVTISFKIKNVYIYAHKTRKLIPDIKQWTANFQYHNTVKFVK